MEQKNFCISSLYNLLNPDNINVQILGNKFRLVRPSGLSNLHQIQFRDLKGDLLPFTNIELPKLKAELSILSNGLKSATFEGENTLDLPAKFSYSNESTNKIITIDKAWTYDENEESQIIYNIEEIYNLMNNKLKDYFTKTTIYQYFTLSKLGQSAYASTTKFYTPTPLILSNRGFGNALITNDKKMIRYDRTSQNLGFCDVSDYDWVWLSTSRRYEGDQRSGEIIICGKEGIGDNSNIEIYYYDCRSHFVGEELSSDYKLITIYREKLTHSHIMRDIPCGTGAYYNNFAAIYNGPNYLLVYGENKKLYVDVILRGTSSGTYKSNNLDLSDSEAITDYYDYIKYIFILTAGFGSNEKFLINCLVYLNNHPTYNYIFLKSSASYSLDGTTGEMTFSNWEIVPSPLLNGVVADFIDPYPDCVGFPNEAFGDLLPFTFENYTAISTGGAGILYYTEEFDSINFRNIPASFNCYAQRLDGLFTRCQDLQGIFWKIMTHREIKQNAFNYPLSTRTGNYWDAPYQCIGMMANEGAIVFYNYDEELTPEMIENAIGVETLTALNVKASGVDTSDNAISLNPDTEYLTTNDNEFLELKDLEISDTIITGTAEIPQITFSGDYSINFILRIYTEPYYFELYTQKNYTQEGNTWNFNVVDSQLSFKSSNIHVLNTLEYLILLQYTYNDIILKVSGFPNNDQVIFHLNDASFINFKTMITDNTTQALFIELLSDEGDNLTVELLKKIFGKITLSIDWVQ